MQSRTNLGLDFRGQVTIKSLFSFAHRVGYLQFDVGKPLRLPAVRNRLSERILTEPEIKRIISLEPVLRNRVMLLVLYGSGMRVSELSNLTWRDVQPRQRGQVQLSIMGKGDKVRTILLPKSLTSSINSLRNGCADDDPVFKSRRGRHLHPSQIWRIVEASAKRAGITKNVSPHWFRHAHASHAIDNQAPLHVIQQCLGHSSVAVTSMYLHSRPSDGSALYLPL